METIINFVRSENYYLTLYFFALALAFFALYGWNKSYKMGKEVLDYINLNKKKILDFYDGGNPYIEGKPLSQLIQHMIGDVKASNKITDDTVKEKEAYKEKMKIEIDKLNQKINEMTIEMEKTKKRDRKHICHNWHTETR